MKYRTMAECVAVERVTWAAHVAAFRARASEEMREALARGDAKSAEHWRLFVEAVELDPRDWDGYGLLDRWAEAYTGSPGDCSSGCTYYRPLAGELGADWGVCANPVSHRTGKLTFEHQGCPAFELEEAL
jgi:hypothetical protein